MNETLVFEVIVFLAPNENSSAVLNGTLGPQNIYYFDMVDQDREDKFQQKSLVSTDVTIITSVQLLTQSEHNLNMI